jgi:KaiC/GvpD/RAD55 family RecA-like ATPase
MPGEKVPTGIPGLDEMLDGGLPRGRSILVSGTAGTGKTTFAIQYLYGGAIKYNEPGILVTLEQNNSEICKDMQTIGIDLKKLQEEGKLIIIDTSLSKVGIKDYMSTLTNMTAGNMSLLPGEFNIDNLIALIIEASKKIGAKRIAIDSIPALDYLIKDKTDVRRALIHMNYELKSHNLTTLMLTEGKDEDTISQHGVEEYITDGVIILKINEALDTRTIKIRKMRTTKHTLKPNTFQLTQNGIQLKH